MEEMTKMINRNKMIEMLKDKDLMQNYSEGQIETMIKLAENTKEALIKEDGKALILLGMNVYTVTYQIFSDIIKKSFEDVSINNKKESKYIKIMDKSNKLINKG